MFVKQVLPGACASPAWKPLNYLRSQTEQSNNQKKEKDKKRERSKGWGARDAMEFTGVLSSDCSISPYFHPTLWLRGKPEGVSTTTQNSASITNIVTVSVMNLKVLVEGFYPKLGTCTVEMGWHIFATKAQGPLITASVHSQEREGMEKKLTISAESEQSQHRNAYLWIRKSSTFWHSNGTVQAGNDGFQKYLKPVSLIWRLRRRGEPRILTPSGIGSWEKITLIIVLKPVIRGKRNLLLSAYRLLATGSS